MFEKIPWFIEDQAFTSSHDLVPSSSSLLSVRSYWRERGGGLEGCGGRDKSCDGKKAWSSIYHSILTADTRPAFFYVLSLCSNSADVFPPSLNFLFVVKRQRQRYLSQYGRNIIHRYYIAYHYQYIWSLIIICMSIPGNKLLCLMSYSVVSPFRSCF